MNWKFKYLLATIVITLFVTGSTLAQGSLGKGNKQLNAGVGLSAWGVPLYVGLDFGVHPDITIGPEVSFRSYTQRFNSVNYTHSIFSLGFNGNYHFNRILEMDPEWDLYAGLTLGYYVWSSPNDYPGTQGTALGLRGQIGARYFFSNNFGVNLEFGGGSAVSGGKFGVTFKL